MSYNRGKAHKTNSASSYTHVHMHVFGNPRCEPTHNITIHAYNTCICMYLPISGDCPPIPLIEHTHTYVRPYVHDKSKCKHIRAITYIYMIWPNNTYIRMYLAIPSASPYIPRQAYIHTHTHTQAHIHTYTHTHIDRQTER
jgi:hypothetical protein